MKNKILLAIVLIAMASMVSYSIYKIGYYDGYVDGGNYGINITIRAFERAIDNITSTSFDGNDTSYIDVTNFTNADFKNTSEFQIINEIQIYPRALTQQQVVWKYESYMLWKELFKPFWREDLNMFD